MVNVLEKVDIKKAWLKIENAFIIRNERDHKKAVKMLDDLIDVVGDDQKHELFGFMEVLGIIIENYESEDESFNDVDGAAALKYLMSEHGLQQKDMSEIGSQGVVSETLSGKRKLNVSQIKKLSKRFNVSPAVFLK